MRIDLSQCVDQDSDAWLQTKVDASLSILVTAFPDLTFSGHAVLSPSADEFKIYDVMFAYRNSKGAYGFIHIDDDGTMADTDSIMPEHFFPEGRENG